MASAVPIKNPGSSFILPDQTCQRLTLAQIEPATRNFDESLVIGRGGSGIVYKSLIKFGSVEVAIKRLNSTSSQGADEFEAEVKLLSTLRHGNLVPLIGYCSEGKEMILAYEFMPNGTLEDHLHKGVTELSWLQRLKICTGAARGLDYLHTGTSTQHGVIHRDVKTSNILLDSNFEGRISDFGLAKVTALNQTKTHVSTNLVKGTFGYIDPYYFCNGKLTRKSDVYAFGVVLFEVLSGKQAVDQTLDESIADWAQEHVRGGRLSEIVSHTLIGQISKKCLKDFTSIAVKCLNSQPKQRPTMAEIVVKLESILSREREAVGPTMDDGGFISKVRYFFTSKTDLIHLSRKPFGATLKCTELLRATKNYKEAKLCIYSLDTKYKGWVDEKKSTYVSVKSAIYVRTRPADTFKVFRPEEFHHPNLVKLFGYCLEYDQLSCVYEQPLDTSLDELLYGGKTVLSWAARLKVAVGAAEGLRFLHKKGYPGYNLFKTTCILVDTDYNARLRDFEVESSFADHDSLFSFAHDSTYYHAPDLRKYLEDKLDGIPGQNGFIVENEIYSFGVVLLEILKGKKAIEFISPEQYLVKFENPRKIVDPRLLGNDNNNPPKGVFMFAKLVSECLQLIQNARPSIEEIINVLSECKRMITT